MGTDLQHIPLEVYQAGPISNVDPASASQWRNELKQAYKRINWVDPLVNEDFSDAAYVSERVVEEDKALFLPCDALYVRRVPGVETWGTPMEVVIATNHGIPVFVHNTDDSPCSPWLRYHATAIRDSREATVNALVQHHVAGEREVSLTNES